MWWSTSNLVSAMIPVSNLLRPKPPTGNPKCIYYAKFQATTEKIHWIQYTLHVRRIFARCLFRHCCAWPCANGGPAASEHLAVPSGSRSAKTCHTEFYHRFDRGSDVSEPIGLKPWAHKKQDQPKWIQPETVVGWIFMRIQESSKKSSKTENPY